MDEEELFAGPEGVLLADSGDCACFIVSRLEVAADGGAAAALVDGSAGVSHGGDVEAKAWVGVPGLFAHGGYAEARVVAPDHVAHGGDGDVFADQIVAVEAA
ncbi:hypothetical protein TRIUR3_33090 [Triticum urartu]|uniref:Uncharacterized protein n=1 Tax=Triticum urartu TaxID=4572 RepID=M8A405_TRIUA|nr:hypothetical protein TRIUR3_33090 [Triticum urartu]